MFEYFFAYVLRIFCVFFEYLFEYFLSILLNILLSIVWMCLVFGVFFCRSFKKERGQVLVGFLVFLLNCCFVESVVRSVFL